MDVNKILTADILDILFEGKNKAYGAYDLRRTYEKRIKIALAGTFALCLLLFVASFVANSSSKSKAQIISLLVQHLLQIFLQALLLVC